MQSVAVWNEVSYVPVPRNVAAISFQLLLKQLLNAGAVHVGSAMMPCHGSLSLHTLHTFAVEQSDNPCGTCPDNEGCTSRSWCEGLTMVCRLSEPQ